MNKLTKCLQGIGIQKNDRVLIQLWGKEIHKNYLQAFKKEAYKYSNQITIKHHNIEAYGEAFKVSGALEDYDYELYENKDVVLDLMAQSIAPTENFNQSALENYKIYMGEIFKRLMAAKTFVQLRLPTNEMAKLYGLSQEKYSKILEVGLDVDYDKIHERGKELIESFSNAKEIVIETGKEKLTLITEDRPWHNDAGRGDLPCGEVYTACHEESSHGSLYIEETKFMGKNYKDLVLTFEEGILVKSSDEEFLASFKDLSVDERKIGEFGIGTNDQLTQLVNVPVLDEKISGTAHIALGRNTMFGGNNKAEIHHDLVFKPKRILVDQKPYTLKKSH